MATPTLRLNSRGLLAAAMATAASAEALAEQAGRVSFVHGQVTATASDGSVRTLARGDVINGGDRISTGSGRLQLRFSDGGFVALQPNTVFGVDQYLYANKRPEETSLFFSLLQGGMRTITGAIGKINKQSYKVRTPVATIGIRGTEYLAEVDAERTLVSVGAGLVYVANAMGDVTGGAGQSIEARLDLPPRLSAVQPDIKARAPEGESEDRDSEEAARQSQREAEQLREDGNNRMLANLLEPDGITPHPVPTYVDIPLALPNGSGYSITFPDGSGNIMTVAGMTAVFDPATGAIVSLTPDTQAAGAAPLTPVITGTRFLPGTIKTVNSGRAGAIGWGELTDGVAEDYFAPFPASVSPGQHLAYMLGQGVTPSFSGTAHYSLQGGTPARQNLSSSTGVLERFNLDINLLTGLADIDLQVGFGGESINANASGLSLQGSGSAFNLNGIATTSSANNFCNSGCSTEVSGFFAAAGGSQVGASYKITSFFNGYLSGVAALGQAGMAPASGQLKAASMVSVIGSGEGVIQNLDQVDANFTAGNVLVDASGCGGSCTFTPGTLTTSSLGKSNYLYWGEYSNGTPAGNGSPLGLPAAPLGVGAYAHYMTGKTLSAAVLDGRATASYSLRAAQATPARGMDSLGSPISATLNSATLKFNLFTGLADLDMSLGNVGGGTETITVTGRNLSMPLLYISPASGSAAPAYGNGFSFYNLNTTSSGGFCGSGCSTEVKGIFAGDSSEIGMAYKVSAIGYLAGVAVLGQDGSDSNIAHALPSGRGYVLAADRGGFLLGSDASDFNTLATATLDTAGNLQQATDSSGTLLAKGTASQSDTGTYKSLHWGRYSGNGATVTYGNQSGSLGPESIHYVVGAATSPTAWNQLNGDFPGSTASYRVVGHTTPTDAAGNTGYFNSASLTVHLGAAPTMDVALQVGMGADVYDASGTGLALPSSFAVPTFAAGGLATTVNGGVCGGSGCRTNINGFFAGSQAQQAGLSYNVVDERAGTKIVSGAAAFSLNGIQ